MKYNSMEKEYMMRLETTFDKHYIEEKDRVYIKSKYSDRKLLRVYRARYDNKYNTWYTFKESALYEMIASKFELYTDEEWKVYKANYDPTKHIKQERKKIINLETGEVFPSMTEACYKYEIDKRNFSKSIKNGWAIGGYHWMYLEDYKTKENKEYGK